MGKKEEERRVTPGWAHVGSIAAMRATKTFPAKNSATERRARARRAVCEHATSTCGGGSRGGGVARRFQTPGRRDRQPCVVGWSELGGDCNLVWLHLRLVKK